ncbi:MAG: YciI family protein [Polyangiaceae bacterium]
MRFLVIVPATKDSEAGVMPTTEMLLEMQKYNEELVKAGVMLGADGLHPSAKGARVVFHGPTQRVLDGPFAESKELIAGYWIWQCRSRDEAIAWLKRAPFGKFGSEPVSVEIRQIFDQSDFAEQDPTGEIRAKNAALQAEMDKAR